MVLYIYICYIAERLPVYLNDLSMSRGERSAVVIYVKNYIFLFHFRRNVLSVEIQRETKYTTKCGWWGWRRCSKYK